jgi:superfamily II RNA helicase
MTPRYWQDHTAAAPTGCSSANQSRYQQTGAVERIDTLPPPGADPVEVVEQIAHWSAATGRPLYPHQEEAALSLASGDHVVLATPTGSGKSLVATIGIALALNRNERAVWTAPIKALVAEKFFELVGLFGAEHIGLATGDAAINADAPILVCTAEILANRALAGRDDIGFACLDEFHYYAERDRGWAWQVPLLEMNRCQFLLASATLGDMAPIAHDLKRRSGRVVTEITSIQRPTPLYHQWRMSPVAQSVTDAVADGLSPVYVVHSTQAGAIERAQALVSLPLTTREQREQIAAAVAATPMKKGFGQTLARLLRNGVGVHHAGMLPRHRRLVERLAAEGLLPVICGTDTLGVGINIPIRTVLLTSLTKFDGTKVRVFTAREFHQIAGRAGRPGFDPDGHVWAQAPDHVIENERALARAGDDPKARRKAVRAKPPERFVHFDEATFERLIAATPEPLISRFKVSADLVATVLARPDGPLALKELLATNHDPPAKRRQHRRRAIAIYRTLETAGIAERRRNEAGRCVGVSIGSLVVDSQERTALQLSSSLSTFAIEVLATLEVDDPEYVLDVVSVIEAVVENPRQILLAQQDAARAAAIAEMKAAGVPYEERIERLESVSWPQPLAELIEACFETYRREHPWIDLEPSPKSIVREMIEQGDTFDTFVQRYRLQRSEGLLLRYLTDVWRALDRSLADAAYVPLLEDTIEWLRTLIRATDATLLQEWELLAGGPSSPETQVDVVLVPTRPPEAWRRMLRTTLFGWVELLAARRYDELARRCGWTASDLEQAMTRYWEEHDEIGIDTDARQLFDLTEEPGRWILTQVLDDPVQSNEWRLTASVDLEEALAEGGPRLQLAGIEGPAT